ncbi:TetR/AcrR family transcriptional regulator [Phytoactinopolyspora mesophila]|nr:TetR/AcrR family transcriptional regulator C-terminal domain-containing protein [Phytoactinopolyspora mesophila]
MNADQQDGYPVRTLELMWGLTTPSSRGPKASLNVEKIVRTAIGIADAEGLDAVSMRRIAEELGFTTMSIYRHIPSKEDLLDLMQDAAAEIPADVDFADMPQDNWREAIHWWAQHNLMMFRRHPWWLDLPISAPPMGPHHVRWMEQILHALRPTGLPADEKLGILLLVSMYALSIGRLDYSMSQGSARTGVQPEEWVKVYSETLAKVIDPAEFPAVAELIQANVLFAGPGSAAPESGTPESAPERAHADSAHSDQAHSDQAQSDQAQLDQAQSDQAQLDEAQQDLRFGLDIILDGIEALIARRQAR